MLHNTGSYGPNETPVNMAGPGNVTPGGHMNIVNNINNLAKLGHGNTPGPCGPYGFGDYGAYHRQNYNMASQMAQFPNHQYQHFGYPQSYSNHNPVSINQGIVQNGMLPMNLNVHNELHTNIMYPYEKSYMETCRSDIIKEENEIMVPLNIPQTPNRVLPKQPLFGNDYTHNNSFQNYNENIEIGIKPHERIEISSTRRKKIENTVKLIENLLINSANSKQTTQDSLNNISVPKYNDSYQRNQSNTSPGIPISTEQSSVSTTQASPSPSPSPDLPPKNFIEQNSIIKTPEPVNIIQPMSIDEQTDNEDTKPLNLLLDTKNIAATSEICVEIKADNISWADTDYGQPYLKDSNSFQREDGHNLRIIDSHFSIVAAFTAINTEIKSEGCFECPNCGVLFVNPKRFLIHTKWHTFGLTHDKRTELQKGREERRNQKKEAKILEKMNSEEVTEKVEGNMWPCKECDKVFSSKGSLKNHKMREHPTRPRECKICHKSIMGWVSYRNHMTSHVGDAGVGFQCSECPKRFKYAHSLAKHADTHLEKTHGCAECPKKFGSQILLKMHMKTHERHSKGTTFHCTYCGKGFYESYTLQIHERTHRNERPYECNICKTSYVTNSSLKRHLKVSHSTSKPFECSVCHRNFSTEPIRDRHEQRLHSNPEDFKFPCKLCTCKYFTSKELKKHNNKAHPKIKRRKKGNSDTEAEDYSE